MTDNPEAPASIRPRRSPIRRAGCTILLIFWFTLLLMPCFLIVMATQGEIIIPQGSLPTQHIRVWLIMEAEERGLGVSSTAAQQIDPNTIWLQTSINFLLWSGQADSLIYCEFYTRENADSEWLPTFNESGECG